MAATASTTTLTTGGCQKHAFALPPFLRPHERRSGHRVPARQSAFCPSHRLQHASDISVAGDDPVNETDPLGLHNCSLNPFTWGGCAENVLGAASLDAFRSLLDPAIEAALNEAKAYESNGNDVGAADCATLTSYSGPDEQHTWVRAPDWIGIDVNGTYLAPLVLLEPELAPLVAHLDVGYLITIDRYGDVFFGLQGGATLFTGVAQAADAGWIFDSNAPSQSDLRSFISGWSVSLGGNVPFVGAQIVYGDVGSSGWHAFGIQYELGLIYGKGVTFLDSYEKYLFNIGREW
jgi:hypothetical protein